MDHIQFQGFEEWASRCSRHITSDVLWKFDAYRVGLYLLYCAGHDCRTVHASIGVRDQLERASGGISAALSEGYSRSTRADRLRFYGSSLGSIRETVTWYSALQWQLEPAVLEERLALISRC